VRAWRWIGFIAAGLFLADELVTLIRQGPDAFVPPLADRAALVRFAAARFGWVAAPLLVAACLVRSRGQRACLLALPVLVRYGAIAALYVWLLFSRQIWMSRATMMEICAQAAGMMGCLLAATGLWGRARLAVVGAGLLAAAGLFAVALGSAISDRVAPTLVPKGAGMIACGALTWLAMRRRGWIPSALAAALAVTVWLDVFPTGSAPVLGAAAAGLLNWLALVAFLELSAPTVDPPPAPAYHGGP
jgi:hypothetical protein